MHGVDSQAAGEHGAREMRRGADARRRIAELARILFRVCDELAQRLHRHRRVHVHHRRHHRDPGDRHEFGQRIEARLRKHELVDDEIVGRTHHQRVTVGRSTRDRLGADHAAAAAARIDHDRLAESLFHRGRNQSRDHVASAARGIGHDDRHRPLGKGGKGAMRRERCGCRRDGEEGASGQAIHGVSPVHRSMRIRS